MRIDLIYATNSSGTFNAAELVKSHLEQAGHRVSMIHARDVQPDDVGRAELTILGSCTWERFEGTKHLEGQLQQHMYVLVGRLHKKSFRGKRFAIFALGDSSYTNFCHAANELEHFVKNIEATKIGPTLRIDSWFFNEVTNRQLTAEWADSIAKEISTLGH